MGVKDVAPKTEGELFDMLERKLCTETGNGVSGVLIAQVRDAAGLDAKRSLDAVYMGFWPSRGLLIEGFEMKSSRSDWLRELGNPAKAEDFIPRLDKFWIVAGRSDIVKEGELPPGWGLLVPRGSGLTQIRAAEALRDLTPEGTGRKKKRPLPPEFDRGMLVSMLRNASHRAQTTPQEISDAEQRGFDRGVDYAESDKRNVKVLHDSLTTKVREFEQALGVSITGLGWPRNDPAAVGAKLKAVLAGEAELNTMEGRYRRIVADMAALLATGEQKLEEYGMKRDLTPQEQLEARRRADPDF
ncbi:MAG: hypothetical protein ABW167_05270 [Baekduia sp.]